MACESHISTIRVVIAYETNTDVLDVCMQADSLTMLTCLLTVIFCLSYFLSAISSSGQLVSRVTDSTHVLTILVDSVRLVLYHSYKESLQVPQQSGCCALSPSKACDLILSRIHVLALNHISRIIHSVSSARSRNRVCSLEKR
jgi:hypothetical protein